MRDNVALPQGNFRAILDNFNEGKLLRISSEALVMAAPGDASTTGFLVRDTDFWVRIYDTDYCCCSKGHLYTSLCISSCFFFCVAITFMYVYVCIHFQQR